MTAIADITLSGLIGGTMAALLVFAPLIWDAPPLKKWARFLMPLGDKEDEKMGRLHSTKTLSITNGTVHTIRWHLSSPVMGMDIQTDGLVDFQGNIFGRYPDLDAAGTRVAEPSVQVNGQKKYGVPPVAMHGSGDFEITVTNSSGATRLYQIDIYEAVHNPEE